MSSDEFSRRRFLGGALTLGAGAGVAGALQPRPADAQSGAEAEFPPGAVILFQGDSITDAGRDKKPAGPNDARALGTGYPHHLAAYLLMRQAGRGLKIHNRGISGNKVPDLDARWQADCVDLRPDVLSILIGVNDIWHARNGNYDGTVATYESGYAALLARTREALPDTKLVVCEPFVLRCGAVKDDWFPEFDERRAAAKRVAEGAGATWVPFQSTFDEAVGRGTEPSYWAGDGVHPSVAGHGLMAAAWLRAVAESGS